MSLTGAELRLLPYLATHLTVPEIATRLFISRNTVKTEAVSIYRKLDASSRSQAIERAVEVGLLEGSIYPPPANLTRKGDAHGGRSGPICTGGDGRTRSTSVGSPYTTTRFSASLTAEATPTASALDERTAALVRVAATIALDAATRFVPARGRPRPRSRGDEDEIVATLEAVTPVTGTARVVRALPKIALALGYDVEDALEGLDP